MPNLVFILHSPTLTAPLDLGTTNMLHAYWLADEAENNSFGVWYQMTGYVTVLNRQDNSFGAVKVSKFDVQTY